MNRISKVITSGTVGVLLAFGGSAFIAPAAHATEVCVPSGGVEGRWIDVPDILHPAVGTPTIVIDNPDYVPGVDASTVWYNFAPNEKGPFEGTPTFPEDANGVWVGPHTVGGPSQDTEGVFQQGNGNGSWFYRDNTPAVPPVGEPTITITNPDYVPERVEITPDTWVPPIAPVICEPVDEEPPTEEPPVVTPPVVNPPAPPAPPATPVVTETKAAPVAEVETLAVTGADDTVKNIGLALGALALIGAGAWAMRRQGLRA